MKIKTAIYVLLVVLFVMPVHAQNNDNKDKNKNKEFVQKGKKEKPGSYKDKNDRDDDDDFYESDDDGGSYKKDKVKSNNGNGNAYGNNKNGLEGREFGQERARQAKLKNKDVKINLRESVVINERRLPTFRERLQNAEILLEQQRPSLTMEVYEGRRLTLTTASQKLNTLEKTILIANTILN